MKSKRKIRKISQS